MLNIVLRPHDTWAVCAYEQRTLTDEMIADLHATHPLLGHDHHHLRNDRYQDPVEFLDQHHRRPARPGGAHPPTIELVDPSPATARATVAGLARQPPAARR